MPRLKMLILPGKSFYLRLAKAYVGFCTCLLLTTGALGGGGWGGGGGVMVL